MPARIRQRLTYANVMATLAVFIALGGSSYAVTKISGSQLKNRSVSGKKLKRNTLGSTVVRESRLGRVPKARFAETSGALESVLGEFPPGRLLLRCPGGTDFRGSVCMERRPRPPQSYFGASLTCEAIRGRLPRYQELNTLVSDDGVPFTAGAGELTADIAPPVGGGGPSVIVVTTRGGDVSTVPDTAAGSRPFRCAIPPYNG